MKSIKEILESIFARIDVTHKWQQDFLTELFQLVFSVQGRINYSNLARYSKYNESTFRRNFKKFFDWLNFNLQIMQLSGLQFSDTIIAAIDCSYLPKAGKKTFGLDYFFSGTAGRNKKGLELSLLSLIDVNKEKAWTLDAAQTPAKLSSKQGDEKTYTRIDFYLEQVLDLLPQLKQVLYFVADGFYAKTKVFNTLTAHGKNLITKLRPDANLRFLYKGSHPKGKRGPKTKYAGKVDWKKLDLRKWRSIGVDEKYEHLKIYTQILNSPYFKRNFRIVLLLNTKTKQYTLLACTDIDLDARLIVKYYQLRFKIEFLFRDAKQFTGLTHCQARDDLSLDFHLNMSLAAVNIAQLKLSTDSTIHSMNSLVRKAYNDRLINWLFSQLSSEAKFDLNHPRLETVRSFGCIQKA
ncbi:MAG: transposase [Bacteroidota bacterium]